MGIDQLLSTAFVDLAVCDSNKEPFGLRLIFIICLQMENKNYPMSTSLNTINIAYSIRPQVSFATSHRKHHESSLQNSCPKTPKHSPKDQTNQHFPQAEFNDLNLKYGKSQTLKESVFNKMRIHIYRREKRPKWMDLPDDTRNDHNNEENRHYASKEKQIEERFDKNRQIKISLKGKNRGEYKIKTSSSEESAVDFKKKRMEEKRLHKEFQMVNREKINSIVRDLLRNAKYDQNSSSKDIKNMQNDAIKIIRKKSRNLSDSINSYSKKYPFQFKKIFSPQRILPKTNEKTPANTEKTQPDAKPTEVFEAWENTDIFSSNKNGIIQYTKEQVGEDKPAIPERKEDNIFASRKKRKFLIREKK